MNFNYKCLKLMAEVQCWPIWNLDDPGPRNIDPEHLLLSKELINDLDNWTERFDAIYKLDSPNLPLDIGFKSEEEENLFFDDGWLLLARLKEELPKIEWWYDDFRFDEIYQVYPNNKKKKTFAIFPSITPKNIIDIRRLPNDRIVWLEKGDDARGLEHIIKEHTKEFAKKNIPESKIFDVIFTALEKGKIVGYQ